MFKFFPFGERYPPKFREDLKVRKMHKKPAFSKFRKPAVHYTYLMRMAEHFGSKNTTICRFLGHYYRFAARHYGDRYGILIPSNVAPGPGLFIVHVGGIIVNGHAQIGKNCRIHAGVNIGQSSCGVPQIGDNVYIGPGAKLFGNITIGDNVKIGANAVVHRSVPPNSVVYGPYSRVVSGERNTENKGEPESLPVPEAGLRSEEPASTSHEIIMRVMKHEIPGLTPQMMEQKFDEAGIDISTLASLRSAIEAESYCAIPDAGWSQVQTLNDITQLLSRDLR